MRIIRSTTTFIALGALVTIACGGGTPTSSVTSPSSPTTPATPTPGQTGTPDPTQTPTPNPTPSPSPSPSPTGSSHAAHHRCGWIGADTFADGKATFLANPDFFYAIHPKWFTLNSDGTPRTLALVDDAEMVAAAHAHGVKIWPLIDSDDASYLRAAMQNPQAHAQALAQIVQQHGYDGIELDYEHLWSKSDRAPFTALVTAVAQALHAQGKQVSLALTAMATDDGNNGYDYKALQGQADVLHLMGYDYHYLGGDHLGPLAPIGWLTDVVTRVESLGAPGKYTLGIANYGIGNGWYTSGADAQKQCGANYPTTTDHMNVCPYGHQTAGVSPHCTTAKGDVWFEDGASATEKAQLAKAHNLGGVGYWTVGAEPSGFMSALQQAYP
jgi:spore germination protein YaaH